MSDAPPDRVRAHSNPQLRTSASTRRRSSASKRHATGDREAICRHVDALDREWDVERYLQMNAGIVSLSGVVLGAMVSRRFLVLPALVFGFFFQHATQGSRPPLPVFRKTGVQNPARDQPGEIRLEGHTRRLRARVGADAEPARRNDDESVVSRSGQCYLWLSSLPPAAPATHRHKVAKTAPGADRTARTAALETGANLMQAKAPVEKIAMHLNGFHVSKDDPTMQMEAHHYCNQASEDLAQCVLFDGNTAEARMMGIEYIHSGTALQHAARRREGGPASAQLRDPVRRTSDARPS